MARAVKSLRPSYEFSVAFHPDSFYTGNKRCLKMEPRGRWSYCDRPGRVGIKAAAICLFNTFIEL